jgi:transcriptional regulator with XRE-family HTH domain
MRSVTSRLRIARRSANLTQAMLAATLGVGRSAVAQWEREDGSSPTVAHLSELARALDCSFEWLATGRGSRRCPGDENNEGAAVVLAHFARNDQEEQMLELLRALDRSDRQIVLTLAELLADKSLRPKARRKAG